MCVCVCVCVCLSIMNMGCAQAVHVNFPGMLYIHCTIIKQKCSPMIYAIYIK